MGDGGRLQLEGRGTPARQAIRRRCGPADQGEPRRPWWKIDAKRLLLIPGPLPSAQTFPARRSNFSLAHSLVDGDIEAHISLECKTDFLKIVFCRNSALSTFDARYRTHLG